MKRRFGQAISDNQVESLKLNAIPQATKASTNWGISLWREWCSQREVSSEEASQGVQSLSTPLLDMQEEDLAFWFTKFILEVRKVNGDHYPQNRFTP